MQRAEALQDADYDLGSHTRKIATESPAAQEWFNRALIWTYAFNHEAAIRCFEAALELDPNCAMAHWGIAFCNGVNYNNQSLYAEPGKFPSNADACRHARLAAALKHNASEVEQKLIDAIQVRNTEPLPEDGTALREQLSQFAKQMEKIYLAHPGDGDIACLFAESMMNIYPWDLWEDGKVREPDSRFMGTARILQVLRSSLEQHPLHPGLLHFYLHTMEMAPTPQDSLAECARLRDLAKDAGHLLHMPSHIDVIVGNYRGAVVANTRAIETDRKYIERNGADNFYMLYCCHDCHMLVYAAMLAGDLARAQAAAQEVRGWLSKPAVEQMLRDGMADVLESFMSLHLHVMVRFGQWQEILEEKLPLDEKFQCVTLAMTRYARVLAYAALKDVRNAVAELKLFEEAYALVPDSRTLFNNTCRTILAVAQEIARGEVAYRRGDFEEAFERLRQAVKLDDGMLYDEPWGWMQPARHALGALLLEQGRSEEALEVYREDLKLGHHPCNIWSLHGLAECLEIHPDLAKAGEVAETSRLLTEAMKFSDVKVNASCQCRLSKCS